MLKMHIHLKIHENHFHFCISSFYFLFFLEHNVGIIYQGDQPKYWKIHPDITSANILSLRTIIILLVRIFTMLWKLTAKNYWSSFSFYSNIDNVFTFPSIIFMWRNMRGMLRNTREVRNTVWGMLNDLYKLIYSAPSCKFYYDVTLFCIYTLANSFSNVLTPNL